MNAQSAGGGSLAGVGNKRPRRLRPTLMGMGGETLAVAGCLVMLRARCPGVN